MTAPSCEIVLDVDPSATPEDAATEAVRGLLEAMGIEGVDLLEKAVAPHRSHYQQRTKEGQFARPHVSRVTPRDERGRFRQRLTREECREAGETARNYVKELSSRLQGHLGLLKKNAVSASEWESMCGAEIRHFYELIYRTGKQSVGDPAVTLTPQDRAAISRLVRDELDYLHAFGEDMAAGRGSISYDERMLMYGRAAAEAWMTGWAMGDQRLGRKVRWVFGETEEHCVAKDAASEPASCSAFEAMGWMPIRKFLSIAVSRGYVPRSGMLACHGIKCLCYLEESLNGVVQPPFTMDAPL